MDCVEVLLAANADVLKTIADARPRNLLCQMRTVFAALRSVIA